MIYIQFVLLLSYSLQFTFMLLYVILSFLLSRSVSCYFFIADLFMPKSSPSISAMESIGCLLTVIFLTVCRAQTSSSTQYGQILDSVTYLTYWILQTQFMN